MKRWAEFDDKFHQLSPREKWLAQFVGIFLILFVGFTYGLEPALKENNKLKANIATKTMQLNTLTLQQQAYEEALSLDPDAESNTQLDSLNKRMTELDRRFANELSELISPFVMPVLMDEVLSLSGALALVNMQSVAPINIFANKPDMQDVALYQHAIQLTFTGSYTQIQAFLAELEATNWQVYWRTMEYDVEEYPKATLMIEFYTLSTDKELLRV